MNTWDVKIGSSTAVEAWGAGRVVRFFPDDLLGGCFERTLQLSRLKNTNVEWLFTGPRAGVTLRVDLDSVTLTQRYYDSPAFAEQTSAKSFKHPEWTGEPQVFPAPAGVRELTIRADSKLNLIIHINGVEAHRQLWMPDLSRHQLRLTDPDGFFQGRLVSPGVATARVRVDPTKSAQTMIGFGGTAAATAYALLSEKGKLQWWELVQEYNLLIQREYPVGRELRPEMDNWDSPASATPHYYGDNFPNSELSDFEYVRKIRSLGGSVWFEFWHLPQWAENNCERYAAAVVAYCRASQEKAGAPPDVVGIQNEVGQTDEMWQQMTLALRRALDEAGFGDVQIHMSDDGWLAGASRRANALKQEPAAWSATDFAASHCYDYQNHLHDPDSYDVTFEKFKQATDGKPFLSTEVCVNFAQYQHDSYRLALSMAQLYQKNLVLGDAVALCYCWTLLNVVQSSYGATRSLCVPDETRNMTPRASSNQLRAFGAFSRCVRKGMTRLEAACNDPDLLTAAFRGTNGAGTMIVMNRSHRSVWVDIEWAGVTFDRCELADPFHENAEIPGASNRVHVPAGAIVTLTNVI